MKDSRQGGCQPAHLFRWGIDLLSVLEVIECYKSAIDSIFRGAEIYFPTSLTPVRFKALARAMCAGSSSAPFPSRQLQGKQRIAVLRSLQMYINRLLALSNDPVEVKE
jgi:hypothetical protein